MKLWRRITVDGVFYRWLVEDTQSRKGTDTFQRSIVIHAEEHPDSKCVFVSDQMGHLRLWNSSHPLEVRGRLVSNCIRYALQHGWDPADPEKALRVDLTAELAARLNALTD